jgi:hypothetical protein
MRFLKYFIIIGTYKIANSGTKVASLIRMTMENGEYYWGVSTDREPPYPTLIMGYRFDGTRVEIYRAQGTYIVVNTKTAKYLTCLGLEHAHYIFNECIKTLTTEGSA